MAYNFIFFPQSVPKILFDHFIHSKLIITIPLENIFLYFKAWSWHFFFKITFRKWNFPSFIFRPMEKILRHFSRFLIYNRSCRNTISFFFFFKITDSPFAIIIIYLVQPVNITLEWNYIGINDFTTNNDITRISIYSCPGNILYSILIPIIIKCIFTLYSALYLPNNH